MLNAITLYRISHWLYLHRLTSLAKLVKLLIFLIYNSSIPFECEIGRQTIALYGGIGIVIHKQAKIGKNCRIGTNVLIGGRSGSENAPIIGDNVYIATGAKVLGDITINSNVIIGANAVVIKSVPSNCSVGGVPSRILKENINVSDYVNLEVK